jgi:hypothetical protein
VPVSFFTGLSDDLFGERLAAVLTANGVDQSLIARSDRPTTLAFVVLTGGNASYAFYDENTAGRMVSEADLPASPTPARPAFFGGISLAVEPCAEAYAPWPTACHARANSSCSTPISAPVSSPTRRRYRARMDRLLSLADVVKVSDEDLAWLMGDGDLAALAEAMRARGPSLVLVTRGAEGVTAYGGGDPSSTPSHEGGGRGHRRRGRHVQRGLSGRAVGHRGAFGRRGARGPAFRHAAHSARPRGARRRRHRVARGRQPAPPCELAVRALIQRVTRADVVVDGAQVGRTGPGLLILICAMQGDTEAQAEKLAAKIARLRIFEDAAAR